MIQPDLEQSAEDVAGKPAVDVGNGMLHEVGADDFEDEFKDNGDAHTEGKYTESGVALGRDDPVVDLHGVKRGAQGQQVDQCAGNSPFDKDLLVGKKGASEQGLHRAFISLGVALRQNQPANGQRLSRGLLDEFALAVDEPVASGRLSAYEHPALLRKPGDGRQTRRVGLILPVDGFGPGIETNGFKMIAPVGIVGICQQRLVFADGVV